MSQCSVYLQSIEQCNVVRIYNDASSGHCDWDSRIGKGDPDCAW
jgi:hypothetical protein